MWVFLLVFILGVLVGFLWHYYWQRQQLWYHFLDLTSAIFRPGRFQQNVLGTYWSAGAVPATAMLGALLTRGSQALLG